MTYSVHDGEPNGEEHRNLEARDIYEKYDDYSHPLISPPPTAQLKCSKYRMTDHHMSSQHLETGELQQGEGKSKVSNALSNSNNPRTGSGYKNVAAHYCSNGRRLISRLLTALPPHPNDGTS